MPRADSGNQTAWIRRLCKSGLEQGLASLHVRLMTVRGRVGKGTICPRMVVLRQGSAKAPASAWHERPGPLTGPLH
ncbi:hypothetical protein TYRP_022553 [Tyrophagus putrescentiae]|nr:hypothetical protein TYRP_022553 [Tyrophagus putrescentiae]